MKKGEIWNVQFPPGYGHEQAGERPAIILTDNITTAIIIPFTSNVQALRFPFTLEVKPTKRNGLSVNSTALLFQVRAIDKGRITKKIGELEDFLAAEMNNLLRKLLGL